MEIPYLKARQVDTHKGHYGKAFLVGGSTGMAGAIGLAGMAALRGGSGLVTLGVPVSCLQVVASYDPCYITWPLPEDDHGMLSRDTWRLLDARLEEFNCWAVGPGLGRSPGTADLVAWVYENVSQPLVVDADALRMLAQRPESLDRPGGARILTPHQGEFSTLKEASEIAWSGEPASATDSRLQDEHLAEQMAARYDVTIVLKGHHTLVTDGVQSYRNQTGNPGMATGGSGDVLTGLITALVCQGMEAMTAACLGVHVHGRSGDLAAVQVGQVGMTARDLIEFLPLAIEEQVKPGGTDGAGG